VNAVGRRRDGTSFVDRYNPGAWPNPRWTSSPSSTRNTAKRAILAQVREETAERVEVGASHLEVAEWAEERIRELGGQPAFPVNISVDEEAAHATPSIDDETTFGEEMINLDIGVHIDGWLADTAITVDLSGNPELAEASEQALEAALDIVEPGVDTGEIGAEIEDVIDGYGYNPSST